MADLASSLHANYGVAIVNLHRGGLPSLWKQLKMKLTGQVWMDPFVTPVAQVYKYGYASSTFTITVQL